MIYDDKEGFAVVTVDIFKDPCPDKTEFKYILSRDELSEMAFMFEMEGVKDAQR